MNNLSNKVNARGQSILRQIPSNRSIDALISLAAKPTGQEQHLLTLAGYHIHYITGKVVTGYFENFDSLSKVLALPYVRQIEPSAPMYRE
jgi:hypothetical protein